MPLKYRIVLKKDMSKGAAKGSQLYYGQIRSMEKTTFKKLCKLVSEASYDRLDAFSDPEEKNGEGGEDRPEIE